MQFCPDCFNEMQGEEWHGLCDHPHDIPDPYDQEMKSIIQCKPSELLKKAVGNLNEPGLEELLRCPSSENISDSLPGEMELVALAEDEIDPGLCVLVGHTQHIVHKSGRRTRIPCPIWIWKVKHKCCWSYACACRSVESMLGIQTGEADLLFEVGEDEGATEENFEEDRYAHASSILCRQSAWFLTQTRRLLYCIGRRRCATSTS